MKSSSKFGLGGVGGATLIEACIVVMVLCLLLFGGVQMARLYAAKEILDYAAMAGARAKAVGLNEFMVFKVGRVASIPNAGRLTSPSFALSSGQGGLNGSRPGDQWDASVASSGATSPQYGMEISRIPFYLGAENYGRLRAILDYSDWNTINIYQDFANDGEQVSVNISQWVPVTFPFHRAFIDRDEVHLRAGESFNRGARMANHSKLYLEEF